MTKTQLITGLLASGSLGLTGLESVASLSDLKFVFTDQRSDQIHTFCNAHNVPLFCGNPRGGRATSFLREHPIDVLLSINYLFIVEEDVLRHPHRLAANFHGSLLPRYRGRTPHVWAIINNEKETGVTVHKMDAGCDTGDILLQKRISICQEDTGARLLEKFRHLYPLMINELLQAVTKGELQQVPQNHSLATYFGRRTPDDGRICWDWQRERIYNWIRAQAAPYPGAYFIYDGAREVVHASRLSEHGFDARLANGTVLCADPLTVKTPNGAIELTDHTFVLDRPIANASKIILS